MITIQWRNITLGVVSPPPMTFFYQRIVFVLIYCTYLFVLPNNNAGGFEKNATILNDSLFKNRTNKVNRRLLCIIFVNPYIFCDDYNDFVEKL